ncbi:MAG: hypothetical protein CMM75_05440 [Rhodospirillaceae bacterium]|nr:hypothetical protein [Rhodospirillaceae bacterium]|tara:strand:- start:2485 stop:2874 length:390 start_codon:yes stop_codon:yes gene_type:complete
MENIVRNVLLMIGGVYVLLGLWCVFLPEKTSKAVGFDLLPGQGQSEFFTVYGGLEVGLGLLLIVPLFANGDVRTVLMGCVLLHGGLVLFRSVSFFLYSGFATTTYILATVEWVIFLASTILFYLFKQES